MLFSFFTQTRCQGHNLYRAPQTLLLDNIYIIILHSRSHSPIEGSVFWYLYEHYNGQV